MANLEERHDVEEASSVLGERVLFLELEATSSTDVALKRRE